MVLSQCCWCLATTISRVYFIVRVCCACLLCLRVCMCVCVRACVCVCVAPMCVHRIGLDEEGIFRLAGDFNEIATAKANFDAGMCCVLCLRVVTFIVCV